jgi:hypothetical protein
VCCKLSLAFSVIITANKDVSDLQNKLEFLSLFFIAVGVKSDECLMVLGIGLKFRWYLDRMKVNNILICASSTGKFSSPFHHAYCMIWPFHSFFIRVSLFKVALCMCVSRPSWNYVLCLLAKFREKYVN